MLGAAALIVVAACQGCSGISSGFTKVADAIVKPTAREVYARNFTDNKQMLQNWESAYKAAENDSLKVNLPYGEKGIFNPDENFVYSYIVSLQEGEKLTIAVQTDTIQQVFIDVFDTSGAYKPLAANNDYASGIEFTPDKGGTFKVVIQPEMAADKTFFIALNKKPVYSFPVAGKGNGAIGSFWGVDRDGGKRRHEGIDIFAKKGTPVIAVTDGTVSYTGERGIGGKQVWLRDGLFGKSLYYAHLDDYAVQSGDRVKMGDTLGYVGNTGNARFTPPHLHFGIYKIGGAVDPLPYVYTIPEIAAKQFPSNFKSTQVKARGKANLRQGPSTDMPVTGGIVSNEPLMVLGQNKDWLHIRTTSGQKAFLHKSLVKI